VTLSQEDHFVLSRTISGIQEQVGKWYADKGMLYDLNGPKEEVLGYLQGLRDMVNELAGLKVNDQEQT
jgi:hypothetical protein